MSDRRAKRNAAMQNRMMDIHDVADAGYGRNILDQLDATAQSQLRVYEDGTLALGGVKFTRMGLDVSGEINPATWDWVWTVISTFDDAIQWYIGDAILYGRTLKGDGETYADVVEKIGGRYSEKTLRNIVHVASKIPLSLRRDNLSFKHHKVVAENSNYEKDIHYWLQYASDEKLSAAALREAIRGEDRQPKTPTWRGVLEKTRGHFSAARLRQMDSATRREVYDELREILHTIERIERGEG